jgi:hypothetical protein
LIYLDPKRQNQTVDRQDLSVYRQKTLALLSVDRHSAVGCATKVEDKNGG